MGVLWKLSWLRYRIKIYHITAQFGLMFLIARRKDINIFNLSNFKEICIMDQRLRLNEILYYNHFQIRQLCKVSYIYAHHFSWEVWGLKIFLLDSWYARGIMWNLFLESFLKAESGKPRHLIEGWGRSSETIFNSLLQSFPKPTAFQLQVFQLGRGECLLRQNVKMSLIVW